MIGVLFNTTEVFSLEHKTHSDKKNFNSFRT